MRIRVTKIDAKLRGLSPLSFLFVMGIAIYLPTILLLPLYYYFPDAWEPNIVNNESLGKFIFASFIFLVVAPFFETLIFQFGVIKLGRKILNCSNTALILTSGAIFGLAHSPFVTQIMAFISGLLLAYLFIVYERREFSAVLMVSLIHCIRNLPLVILA